MYIYNRLFRLIHLAQALLFISHYPRLIPLSPPPLLLGIKDEDDGRRDHCQLRREGEVSGGAAD